MAKKKNGKANGHSNGKGEFAKRNKSLLGYNSIFTIMEGLGEAEKLRKAMGK